MKGWIFITDWNDFPPNVKAALDEGLPALLQQRASTVGPIFEKLIRQTLQPHAFINLRRVQGLIALIDKWDHAFIEQAAAYALQQNIRITPKNFKQLLQRFVDQDEHSQLTLPMSEHSWEFVRDMEYFIHDQPIL